MDWIFLIVIGFFTIKGYFKGFVSMIFSFAGTAVVFYVAWKLTAYCSPYIENLIGNGVYEFIKSNLDKLVGGTFSRLEEVQEVLGSIKFGAVLSLLIGKIFSGISFEGNLSFGQIFAPSLSHMIMSGITFFVLFFAISMINKLLKKIFEKLFSVMGWNFGNKFLGGLLGMLKGLLIFCVIFFAVSFFSNLTNNQSLQLFLGNGTISSFIFENIIKKLINLFN